MKTWGVISTLVLVGLCFQAGSSAAAEEEFACAHPSLQAIESAQRAGEITEPEAVLYRFYALNDPARLPVRFAVDGVTPAKCGTPAALALHEQAASMPPGLRQQGEAALARPNLPQYIDTQHYRIHYTTTGVDKILNWPDTTYRDAVATACENSWAYFHSTQGWPPPPSDGAAGGGSNLIDCYVINLDGVYGYTEPESQAPNHPNDWTSFFVIDNDYAGFGYANPQDPMKVTVAHEYHHVVQMGLNAGAAGSWFMENTATFMEDEVYDSINDNYNYLQCYFGVPWTRLNSANGCFEYACFIWPTYMSENWSHSVVRDMWVDYADRNNLYASFDVIFGAYGMTLDTAMAEWARWNVYTMDRDDGNHYIEGDTYTRQVNYDNDIATYPRTNVHPSGSKMPQGLGTNYTRFRKQAGSTDNKIIIDYQMLNACSYSHVISFVRKIQSQSVWEEFEVAVDAAGAAHFEMTRWDETEYLFMVVPLKKACGSTGKDFSFNVSTTYTVDAPDAAPARVVRLDQNSPNPFHPSTSIRFTLAEPGSARVQVYDAAGRLVRTLLEADLPAGEHEVHWGGTDDAGRLVTRGVYFCRLQAGAQTDVRKMQLR